MVPPWYIKLKNKAVTIDKKSETDCKGNGLERKHKEPSWGINWTQTQYTDVSQTPYHSLCWARWQKRFYLCSGCWTSAGVSITWPGRVWPIRQQFENRRREAWCCVSWQLRWLCWKRGGSHRWLWWVSDHSQDKLVFDSRLDGIWSQPSAVFVQWHQEQQSERAESLLWRHLSHEQLFYAGRSFLEECVCVVWSLSRNLLMNI